MDFQHPVSHNEGFRRTRTFEVSALLRSVQNRHPPDVVHRLALNQKEVRIDIYMQESCRTRTVRGLRSAPVVAKRTSTGCSATSRALISKRVHVDIIFVFPIPRGSKVRGLRSTPVIAKRTSTGRSATSRALKETRKNSENTQRILRVFVTRTKILQRKTKCFAY